MTVINGSGLIPSVVTDSSASPKGVDSTGVADFGNLIYNAASGKWRSSAGGPINVLDPRYGAKGDGVTDDTSAIQAAVNAASAKSTGTLPGDVWLPPGYGFNFGQIITASGVRIWAYGAQINPLITVAGHGNTLFWTPSGSLNFFEIRGGLWLGTNLEANNKRLFDCAAGVQMGDLVFADMNVTNWGSAVLNPRNVSRVWFFRNVLTNIGGGSANLNAMGVFTDSGQTATQDVFVIGNIVNGSQAAGFSVVNNGSTIEMRVIVLGNTFIGLAGNDGHGSAPAVLAGSIDFESTNTGQSFGRILVGYNHVTNTGSAGWGINDSTGGQFPQADVSYNTVKMTGGGANQGIRGFNADSSIAHNRIIGAATPINSTASNKTGNRFSAGASQGRATLVAGTVTVNTAEVVAGDNILLTVVTPGGTRGEVQVGTIVAGTSFVINSIQPGTASTVQNLDTSTVFWQIVH